MRVCEAVRSLGYALGEQCRQWVGQAVARLDRAELHATLNLDRRRLAAEETVKQSAGEPRQGLPTHDFGAVEVVAGSVQNEAAIRQHVTPVVRARVTQMRQAPVELGQVVLAGQAGQNGAVQAVMKSGTRDREDECAANPQKARHLP